MRFCSVIGIVSEPVPWVGKGSVSGAFRPYIYMLFGKAQHCIKSTVFLFGSFGYAKVSLYDLDLSLPLALVSVDSKSAILQNPIWHP